MSEARAVPPSRSFGEDGARLSYGEYLRLPQLLDVQDPQSGASDELLFITEHQVYELWFTLLLHELERARDASTFLCGAMGPSCPDRLHDARDDELARLRRLSEPSLWDAYLTALSQRGLPVSESEIMDALLIVAKDRGSYDDLWQPAEDLLTHDETTALWRMRHVRMVERQIGTKAGTGGSSGAPYLRGRTRLHFFPLCSVPPPLGTESLALSTTSQRSE
ncbi:hypothetical protein Aph01nite_04370 [Acrocarpospora phusangensis]|uniref:Tryptophan 2,3-dioxygenase n=1 Tax=Acrocarpospora phusangensis TaxID=1070424 RepID=A0A919ULF1_9ACTN|nr:tryptophan 2,3-dioxygenase family protein [Acrocarpospora phusangensis]GIH22127.1 hypothetical protein Aph01nite_04370 [Acrocarpospora phusangensis]